MVILNHSVVQGCATADILMVDVAAELYQQYAQCDQVTLGCDVERSLSCFVHLKLQETVDMEKLVNVSDFVGLNEMEKSLRSGSGERFHSAGNGACNVFPWQNTIFDDFPNCSFQFLF